MSTNISQPIYQPMIGRGVHQNTHGHITSMPTTKLPKTRNSIIIHEQMLHIGSLRKDFCSASNYVHSCPKNISAQPWPTKKKYFKHIENKTARNNSPILTLDKARFQVWCCLIWKSTEAVFFNMEFSFICCMPTQSHNTSYNSKMVIWMCKRNIHICQLEH